MKTGAILSPREATIIRKRLQAIGLATTDRWIKEQCRMIHLTINKAERRVKKMRLFNI